MNRQTPHDILRFALVAAVLLLGISCTQQDQGSSSQENNEPITIGAVLPLTGPISFLGESEKQGMSIAVQKINSRGGIQGREVQVEFEDSNPQGDQGVSAARNLLSTQGADFIFTSTTGVSNTIKESVIQESNALQFVYAMDERIPEGAPNVLRIYPGILEEGKTLMEYARMVKPERVAIIHSNSQAFTRLAEEILEPRLREMSSVNSVTIEGFGRGGYSEIRSSAAKIESFDPEFIFIGAYYNQIAQIIRALKEYNLKQNTAIASVLDATMAVDQNQIEPALLENVVVAVPAYSYTAYSKGADSLRSDTSFVEAYRAEYGKMPNFDAAYAYDAVMMLAQAISEAGSTEPSAVRKALQGIDYQGASGRLAIRPGGNVETSWRLGMYCGGVLVPVQADGSENERSAPVSCDMVTAGTP